MTERQIKTQPLPTGRDMNIYDRANREDREYPSSGPFSWFVAQRALSRSKYVLTGNGYVLLP